MLFTKSRTEPRQLLLKVDDTAIYYVDYFNFVGLTIDYRMTWKNQTKNISNKCLRVIGILNIIKHVIPINIRLLLYNTPIVPHLNYCITARGRMHEAPITYRHDRA